jgi:hypothetical protein
MEQELVEKLFLYYDEAHMWARENKINDPVYLARSHNQWLLRGWRWTKIGERLTRSAG